MKQYTVADSLGREITFDWEDDAIAPTDSDFEEIFKQADSFKSQVTPEPVTTGTYQPKPGDIKLQQQPIAPGPYGEDIARRQGQVDFSNDLLRAKTQPETPPPAASQSITFEEPAPVQPSKFGTGKPFVEGSKQMAAGIAQSAASALSEPIIGAEGPQTPAMQQMYDLGKGIVESKAKPKDPTERQAVTIYKNMESAKKLQTFGQQKADPALNAIAEKLREGDPEAKRMMEDAQYYFTTKEALDPRNAGQTLAAAATIAANSAAYTLASTVPGAGVAAMVGAEQGNWIDGAKKSGLTDPKILREFSLAYGMLSGGIEQIGGEILTAPLRAALGGSKTVTDKILRNIGVKFGKEALKNATKAAARRTLSKTVGDYVGSTILGAIGEGAEEYGQDYLSDALLWAAFDKAATDNPEMAVEYTAKRDAIDLNPLLKKRLEAAKLGAIAGGFTRGAMETAAQGVNIGKDIADKTQTPTSVGEVKTDIGLPKSQKPTEAKTDIGIPQGTKTLAELKIPTPEAYYRLPDGRREEIFGQLSPEEQDRVMAAYPEELLEPKTAQVPKVQKTAEQLSDTEARDILRKAKGVPEIDLSKVTPEQQAEIADMEKYRQARVLKTAQTELSPYQFQQPNDEDKVTGERVAKKYGLVFKEAIPGDRDKSGVRLVFSDPVTENEISLSPETADTEAAKIADKIRQEKPEEYGKKIAAAAGVEFIGRKAQITEATAAGKYNTIAVGNYRTKLGNDFTVPFSASVDEIRAMAEETDKQGAKNVPEVQQRQEKAEIEPSAVIRPNRDYDRMLAAYVKTGKPETSPGRSAHEGLVGVIDQVAPEDIADAVGLSPAEARQAIGDIREQRKSEVSQKVRQAFAPELFYGRPVEEIVEGIRQPRAASGEVIFQREEQFIRAATKKEKYSSSAKNDGYNSIPDKDGFEKVYKPYGEQGAGYYYSRKIEPTQQEAFGGETPVSEIERKAEQRQQKAAVAERQEARKGGEAPLTGLPMFEDQDIEGSQMTLKLQRENKEKVAGLKRRLKDIEWRELDELREAVRVGTLSREDFNKKWENAGKRADAIRRKLYDLTGDAYGESKEYKQRKKVVREKKEKERKSVLDQIAVTSEEYDTEVVDYPARGFLLPDGNYLSIGSGTDHRSINGMVEYPNEDQTDTGYRTKKMERIMADSGAIRFIPESGVFDIKSDPTQEQIDEIRKYAEQNGSVEVEFKNGSSKSYTSDDIYDLSDDIERGGVRFQREERPMDLDTAKEIATSNGLQYVTSTPAEGGPRYTFREPRTGTEFTAKTRGEVRQAIGDLADRVAPRGTTKAGTGVRFQREDEKRTSEQESQLKRLRAEKEARYQQEALPEEVAQWEANNKLIDFFRNNGYTIEETPQGARYVKSSPEVAERYWTAFDRDTDPGIETYEGAEAFGKSRQAPRTEPGVKFSREWSPGAEPLTPEEQRENFERASRDIKEFSRKPKTLSKKAIKELRDAGYKIPENIEQPPFVFDFKREEVPATDREDRDADIGVQTSLQFQREDELIFDAGTAEDEARGKAIADQLGNVKFNGVWKGFRSKDGRLHRDPQLTFTIYDNQGNHGTSILAPLDSTPGQVAKRRAEVLKGEVRFQIEEPRKTADTFFSPVLRAVQGLKQERGTGDQMFAMITKTPGVKEAEWKWMGLDDFLKGKQSVTKREIEEFVAQNQVRVEEVRKGDLAGAPIEIDNAINEALKKEDYLGFDNLGQAKKAIRQYDDWKERWVIQTEELKKAGDEYRSAYLSPTKFSQYTLPGGENYREVLLTLPFKEGRELPPGYSIHSTIDGSRVEDKDGNVVATGFSTQNAVDRARKKLNQQPEYKSSHWDEPNVIAHVRMNDRTGPNGEKVLFVEEIQSDFSRELRSQQKANMEIVDKRWGGLLEHMKKDGILKVVCP